MINVYFTQYFEYTLDDGGAVVSGSSLVPELTWFVSSSSGKNIRQKVKWHGISLLLKQPPNEGVTDSPASR